MKTIKTMMMAVIALMAVLASCASSGGGGGGGDARGALGVWTFADASADVQGWWLSTAENYKYKAPAKLSHDSATLGKGLLRLDVDFTNNIEDDWADIKIVYDFPKMLNMKGKTRFTFDFYYNPAFRSDGGFKPMVWCNNNGLAINFTGESIEGGEDAGEGFLKQKGEVLIMPTSGFMPDMRFIIAGNFTDYKGPVFFDNMRWE
ncbi:MAG: hypothetical protein LBH20_02420 [Treponema sp.]|jgi:hypothetical protein|nr:hypothetical protein [Treponema sp.]